MKKIFLISVFLIFSTSALAEEIVPTTMFASKTEFFRNMSFWSWTDIPKTITTYMDTDQDGKLDVVWAFPIIKKIELATCTASDEPAEEKGTMTFSTCHINEKRQPMLYIVSTKGWHCNTCPYLRIDKQSIRVLKF